MAKLIVLDIESEELRWESCKKLDDYYENLNCTCFDIANRRVGDRRYDIFVDDEGLFKEKPILSAIDTDGNPMLVGNLIFANHDEAGNTTSLSEDDFENILRNMVLIFTKTKPDGYMAVMCDY